MLRRVAAGAADVSVVAVALAVWVGGALGAGLTGMVGLLGCALG